jgi:hypothetical protein
MMDSSGSNLCPPFAPSRKEKTHSPADLLSRYARELRLLNNSTEADFLSLGRSLGNVSSKAQAISESAGSVVRVVAGEGIAGNSEKLRELFESVNINSNQCQFSLERSSQPLLEMTELVEKAKAPLSGFQRIVKQLRMLSVSTKIENARLSNQDSSFDVLADNVEQLSGTIALKSENILRGLGVLKSSADETLSKLVIGRRSTQQLTQAMMHNLVESLALLSERNGASSETALKLAVCAKEVSENISEVISSLQFHDITRQQIEHVAEVFEAVTAQGSGADSSALIMDIIQEVGEIQIDQLNCARDELETAVDRVSTGLRRIAYLLSEISKDITSLVGTASRGNTSFVSELTGSMHSIVESLHEGKEGGKELARAATSTTRIIQELSTFLNDVEEVGSDIGLIALNAQIKAAQSAENGGPLGVLAEAIQALSASAANQTSMIAHMLIEVTRTASELDAISDEVLRRGMELASIEGDVKKLIELFENSHEDLDAHLAKADKDSKGLTDEIDPALKSIVAHARVREVLGDVVSGLRQLIRLSQETGRPNAGEGKEYLKELADRYTMLQERRIHQSHTEISSVETTEGNDGLGDNVELF